MNHNWSVYVIRCSDNSLYTGITTDVERRFQQHADGTGAKYFRGRSPVQIVYLENGYNRSSASKRERQIKAMTRTEKDVLVSINHQSVASKTEAPAKAVASTVQNL